jgi:hydroxyethylthiazole kinase-like sugar kinase family protein
VPERLPLRTLAGPGSFASAFLDALYTLEEQA